MTLRSMEQFDPSVPRQGSINFFIRVRRDRQFESPFFQRRVCELSVPEDHAIGPARTFSGGRYSGFEILIALSQRRTS
jgi:hypothetical protein